MLKNSTEEIVEDSADLVDEFGNVHNIDEVITKAENDVKKKYPKVNFRWSEFENARAKKIAKELGMPYQTFHLVGKKSFPILYIYILILKLLFVTNMLHIFTQKFFT